MLNRAKALRNEKRCLLLRLVQYILVDRSKDATVSLHMLSSASTNFLTALFSARASLIPGSDVTCSPWHWMPRNNISRGGYGYSIKPFFYVELQKVGNRSSIINLRPANICELCF
jgi:hypothetical protein